MKESTEYLKREIKVTMKENISCSLSILKINYRIAFEDSYDKKIAKIK